jgi:hypothetical protein
MCKALGSVPRTAGIKKRRRKYNAVKVVFGLSMGFA